MSRTYHKKRKEKRSLLRPCNCTYCVSGRLHKNKKEFAIGEDRHALRDKKSVA